MTIYPNVGWRAKLAEIEAVNAEHAKYSQVLSPLDEAKLREKKKSLQDAYGSYIMTDISKELQESIKKVELQRNKYQLAKKREYNSWDSAKLSSQYGVTSVILDMLLVGVPANSVTVPERVEKLFNEAKASEDKYSIRALADLLPGTMAKMKSEDAVKINHIRDEADSIIKEMRETPEILKAKDEVFKVFEEFSQVLRDYKMVGRSLGESTNMDWNIRELEVYRDDDGVPAVEMIKTKP
jgi:hypothetical protein